MNKDRARATQNRVTESGLEVQLSNARIHVRCQGVDQSSVDLRNPRRIEFEYLQHVDALLGSGASRLLDAGRTHVFHAGAGACALALAWDATYPGFRQVALEVDGELCAAVTEYANLRRHPRLRLRAGDARAALERSERQFDVLVRDAFDGPVTPRPLMDLAWAQLAAKRLSDEGVYMANVGKDRSPSAKQDVAAAAEVFPNVAVAADPKVWKNARPGNLVLVAWDGADFDEDEADRALRRLPLPTRLYRRSEVERWLGGALPVRLPPPQTFRRL